MRSYKNGSGYEKRNKTQLTKTVVTVFKCLIILGAALFFSYIMLLTIIENSQNTSKRGVPYRETVSQIAVNTDGVEEVIGIALGIFFLVATGIFLSPFVVIFLEIITNVKSEKLKPPKVLTDQKSCQKGQSKLYQPHRYKWLKLTEFLFSEKYQAEIFKVIMADWDEEVFNAESEKRKWKVRWTNVIYTCAFIASMWQKSPLGDLLEFIRKIAK